jgi:stearoyl-CoA desaturase (delta-9 desaturase)
MDTVVKANVGFRNFTFDLLFMHLGVLLVFWTGVSWASLVAFLVAVNVQGFAMTGGMHRYFSHRSFKTGRGFQFLMGLVATTAGQHDPLYWAAIHRRHHRYSGGDHDPHSRETYGMWWAHLGWLLREKHPESKAFDLHSVHDLARYPELVFLNRHYRLVWLAYLAAVFGLGTALGFCFPGLHTSGLQFVAWAFFFSSFWVFHTTVSINSFGHTFGSQRFPTSDGSRNNWVLAFVLLGEGWHNNHHRYPHSERQGFYWWEFDATHCVLVVLSWLGIVWDLKGVPASVYAEAQALQRGVAAGAARAH